MLVDGMVTAATLKQSLNYHAPRLSQAYFFARQRLTSSELSCEHAVPVPVTHRASRSRICKLRLASQKISRGLEAPADVVRWMTAMQAQDFHGAKWAVGLRAPGSTNADIERAIESGQIVRSWPMRGTLHFVAPEDLSWMLNLTAPRLLKAATKRHASLDLSRAVLERARKAAQLALSGGGRRTRSEMYEVFRSVKISPESDRGYQLLWALSQTKTLCFGPPSGTSQTFVLFDEWIKERRAFDRDEALGEFVRRYFRSHGPATLHDFALWSSLTLADAKIGMAVAGKSLAEITIDETAYFLDPNVLDAAGEKGDAVYALPGFDEYLLGYKDRSAAAAAEHMNKILPAANGIFSATIISSGLVVGTWRRVIDRKRMAVTASPFSKLTAKAAAGFRKAIRAYGKFFALPIAIEP
jgi:hypothetical protein